MPFYHKLGNIPHKRHTVFRQPNGNLYHEQLFGTIGFDGMSSLLYHIQPPTVVKEILGETNIAPEIALERNMTMRSLKGFEVTPEDDFIASRTPVLVNNDCYIELASPKKSMTDYFYKNADADEVIFIHRGSGQLKTQLGVIDFSYGDYLVVPRGMIYQLHFNEEDNKLFIVQSFHPIYTPKRYRNWFGQLLEHSPYCERDIRPPHKLETIDEEGSFLIRIKKQDVLYDYVY
ncbi:MAG: homogentisate 1,2-dioxygenase, partial [Crocinitomicaceae bacterium]